jgi:hypothetical protein
MHRLYSVEWEHDYESLTAKIVESTVVAYFKVLSHNLLVGIEKTH